MKQSQVIKNVVEVIKQMFYQDSSGHDWFHIEWVWKMAKQIALKESLKK